MSQNRRSLGLDSSRQASNEPSAKSPCSKSHTPTPGASATGNSQATTIPRKITEATKKELIVNSQSTIKDKTMAEKWLVESSYLVKGETLSTAALAMALLYITNGNITTYAKLIDGMRAVALCMLDQQPDERAKEIANEIIEAAKDAIDEATIEAKENIAAVTENCIRTMEEAAEKRRGEDTKEREEPNTEEGEWRAEESANGGRRATQQQGPQTTYANVAARKQDPTTNLLRATIPNSTDDTENITKEEKRRREDIMEREERREKQVLIDNMKNWEKVEEGEMVRKANEAWKRMEETVAEEIEVDREIIELGGKFVAARKLKNGGIIMEANAANIITWMRDPMVKLKFEEEMGEGIVVKERLYTLIVEFVSTTLKHTLPQSNHAIEEANDLEDGTIHQIRWMRDPERSWGETQTKAHAIITTRDQQAANTIIRKSLIIEGKRHTARKIEDDPRRCYRCQRFDTGHTAATCKEKQACANCNATDHDTGECRAPREAHRCASCTVARRDNQHASWSRKCPIFIRHQLYLRNKYPENHYKYYPCKHIPWTWERKMDGEEEMDREGEVNRWTGNYDRRRHEEERNRRWQERAEDRGYGGRLGGGWDTGERRKGDFYRPNDSRSRSRGRKGRNAGMGGGERNEPSNNAERGKGREEEAQREGRKSKERGGEARTTSGTGASQRTIPASWSRPRANTTEWTGRETQRTTEAQTLTQWN